MPPKYQKPKPGSGGINLLRVSWLFICAWIGVLVYCWQSGMLHASNNETLRYVDKVLNETEVKLVAGIVKTEHDLYEGIIKTENSLSHLRDNIQHLNFERHVPGVSTTTSGHENKMSNRPPAEKYEIHVIFSTDCTPYQDWQSLVVFHSATVVKQKGPVTRIASGCDDEKKAYLSDLYAKLYPQYHVHFTPDFKKDEHSKQSCKYISVYNSLYLYCVLD